MRLPAVAVVRSQPLTDVDGAATVHALALHLVRDGFGACVLRGR